MAGTGDPTDTDDPSTEPTASEQACFELGIKFGSLYHQFAGTPVSPESAPSLEQAIKTAIENQPGCECVRVDIDTDALAATIERGTAAYTELTGRYMEVTIVVEHGGHRVVGEMAMKDGYPLMEVVSVA